MRINIQFAPPLYLSNARRAGRQAIELAMADNKKVRGAVSDCNVVAQEKIWKEAVHRETTAARKWYNILRHRSFLKCSIDMLCYDICLQGRKVGFHYRI